MQTKNLFHIVQSSMVIGKYQNLFLRRRIDSAGYLSLRFPSSFLALFDNFLSLFGILLFFRLFPGFFLRLVLRLSFLAFFRLLLPCFRKTGRISFFLLFLNHSFHLSKSLSPMGNLVLLFSGKLSSGFSVFRKVENGVIAKALFSTGLFCNFSRASGFRLQKLSIRKNRNNGAAKVGHSAFTAAFFHHSQDTTILFGIGCIHPQKSG